jgi:hypothetical protein
VKINFQKWLVQPFEDLPTNHNKVIQGGFSKNCIFVTEKVDSTASLFKAETFRAVLIMNQKK